MGKKVMEIKQYNLLIIVSTLLLVACQVGLDPEKIEPQSSIKTLAKVETNNTLIDGDNQHQVEGENVLFKLDQGCQLDQIFNYSNNQLVTYRFIFKREKLISASAIVPDERNFEKMKSTWNDPEYEPTIENFKQAKASFSKEILKQCG